MNHDYAEVSSSNRDQALHFQGPFLHSPRLSVDLISEPRSSICKYDVLRLA